MIKMKIEIIDKEKLTKNLNPEIKNIIRKIASNNEIDRDIEVIFVTDDEIAKLNSENRGIDKATDVLSFPQNDFISPVESVLGSIVIAPKYAMGQDEDLSDLVIHGMIHLLGFDHEKDQNEWDKKEKEVYQILE